MSIIHGDCIEVLKDFPDEHFDLIVADPPYYRIAKAAWDRQWDTLEEWAEWCAEWGAECCRAMKDNGSFLSFCGWRNTSSLEVVLDTLPWVLINRITWRKPRCIHRSGWDNVRSFLTVGQDVILFYAKDGPTGLQKILPKCAEGVIAYMRGERERAGVSVKECNRHFEYADQCGHWFRFDQPTLPFAEQYTELRRWWNAEHRNGGPPYLEREYEDLRREYEDLRREYEDLRRPFFGNGETDVWDGPITPKSEKKHGAHPTQKPLWIIKKILEHTTRPGALVLDPFLGSGTTAVACAELGRECVGIDMDEGYCGIAERRVAEVQKQLTLETA